jgi:MFS family permease
MIVIRMHKRLGQELEEQRSTDMLGIFVAVLIELPSNQIAALLIEKHQVGRKNLLVAAYFASAIFSLLAATEESPSRVFYFAIAIVKFSINVCFVVVYPFVSDIYHTSMRATALGFFNAVCRIGGMLMPYIAQLAFAWGDDTGPLLAFALTSLLSCIAACAIPYDTANMDLDVYEKKIELMEIKHV